MSDLKRVLIVITSLYNGGAERSLVNFLNELDPNKYTIDLLLFKNKGMFLSQIPDFVNIIETPLDIQSFYGDSFKFSKNTAVKMIGTAACRVVSKWNNYRKGYRWVNFYKSNISDLEGCYDVAFAYTAGEMMYYIRDKVHADKKIVIVHGDYRSSHYSRKYDYEYFADMDKICSVSESCVDILKDEFPEFSEKIRLLPNINSSQLIRKRSEMFYPDEFENCQTRLLSIGRLSNEKGFDMAVEAASILKEKGYLFKWFLIGTGGLEDELKQKVTQCKVEDCFEFLGPRENPYPYVINSDIFVQTSRYEGKSVVLDEAKILAKPIVATAYPTVRDQINEHEGLVVEMSPEGIAEGISELIDNPIKSEGYYEYLKSHEYGNQNDIELYYDVIDN